MLSIRENEHLNGMDCIQKELMGIVRMKEKLTALYYATIIWAIPDDMYTHFNEYILLDDFQSARFGLTWP